MCRVCWHSHVSEGFYFGNGTRQGRVLSPNLLIKYITDMLIILSPTLALYAASAINLLMCSSMLMIWF